MKSSTQTDVDVGEGEFDKRGGREGEKITCAQSVPANQNKVSLRLGNIFCLVAKAPSGGWNSLVPLLFALSSLGCIWQKPVSDTNSKEKTSEKTKEETKEETASSKFKETLKRCLGDDRPQRDFSLHPAIVEVSVLLSPSKSPAMPPAAQGPSSVLDAKTLFVVSDIHGHFQEFFRLLEKASLIKVKDPKEKIKPSNFEWIGGNSVLVLAGDLINKGQDSLRTIKFAQNLEREAESKGGKAIFLAGNHELGFVSNPFFEKYDPFLEELKSAWENEGVELCGTRTDPQKESFSQWLLNRPLAAKVDKIFISHSGWTQNKTLDELKTGYEAFFAKFDRDDAFLCGTGPKETDNLGVMNGNEWWGKKGVSFFESAKILGVKQIVFGHDPKAFDKDGELAGVFNQDGEHALIKVDAGLGDSSSEGGIARCQSWSSEGWCHRWEGLVLPSGSKFKDIPFLKGELPEREKERRGC